MECWGCCVGGRSKQKNFNSFRCEKKEINHRSYSFRVANLNKASSARNKATKQKVSKNTHTAFPKYGKKPESAKRQRAGLSRSYKYLAIVYYAPLKYS